MGKIVKKITPKRVLLVAATASLLFVWWALDSITYQVNCSMRLAYLTRELGKAKQENGSFPRELHALDNENRPVLYLSNGQEFLLVSFGMDGQPDRSYSLDSPPESGPSCLGKNRDTVFSDKAELVFCLK